MVKQMSGAQFADMVAAGAVNLKRHAKEINDLNVFPIPDGDTGDNMLLTIESGARCGAEAHTELSTAAQAIADKMLLGARGNSGVILSQFFAGLCKELSKTDVAAPEELSHAMQVGVQYAYRAVIEPTEGTMLTVMREATEAVSGNTYSSVDALLEAFIEKAKETLERTPEMLPVLKKAGVVDSGGAGLICIMDGMLRCLRGEIANETTDPTTFHHEPQTASLDLSLFNEDSVLDFGYCTELLLQLQRCKVDLASFSVEELIARLETMGESLVAFRTGNIVKIHIHTKTPSDILAFCQQYGEFLQVKIENMALQHNNRIAKSAPSAAEPEKDRKPYAVVAVASGSGIQNWFRECGADEIIDGGQSNNPSAEDMLAAFDRAGADTIFVLPNNSNILLTARQAAKLYTAADVRVIPSRNIGEGYAALSMLDTDSGDTDTIVAGMTEAMEGVICASVSRSVRDTEEVHRGEYIGFVGHEIVSDADDRLDALRKTADVLQDKAADIVILLSGADVLEAEAEAAQEYYENRYPMREIYRIAGGQEIFDYILIYE